jgi:hypothetical protein
MMKKTFFGFIICVILFVFSHNTLLADIGIKGGIGFYNLSSNPSIFSFKIGDEERTPDLKSIMSFQLGAFLSFDISKYFALQPEIYYVMRGTRASEIFDITEVKATLKTDYIDIPLLVKFKIPSKSSIKPILFAGPYIGFRLNAQSVIEVAGQKTEIDYKEQIKNQHMGLIVGGGIEFNFKSMKLILEGRYSFGVTSIYKRHESVPISNIELIPHSFVLMLGIGI